MKNTAKIILAFALLILSGVTAFSQNGTGIYVHPLPYQEIHAKNDKPMPYQYVREADVMWSRIIWRKIELDEKMNHTLALPQIPANGVLSLIDVLLDGIHTKGLTAYKASLSDAGNEFDNIMTEDEIHTTMGAKSEKRAVENLEGGVDTVVTNEPYRSYEIKEYLVKELWFFDKQRSVLDVRIIGICPVRVYLDPIKNQIMRTKVFWVNYSEARPLLAKAPIYNSFTDVRNVTYDDLFQRRYFSSYIYMESNPYMRSIDQYETGLEVLLEADRVKNEIFNFEQDLWEY